MIIKRNILQGSYTTNSVILDPTNKPLNNNNFNWNKSLISIYFAVN